MFRMTLALTAAAFAVFALPVEARDPKTDIEVYEDVDHNGSNMMITIAGSDFEIVYIDPKQSLRRHGVRANTFLFRGTIDDGKVEGDAYVFRSGCDPESYWVSGYFDPQGEEFVLNGEAPIRERNGCEVISHTKRGSNARLVFSLDDGGGSDDGGDGDDYGEEGGNAGEGYCGWWAVYSCHRSRSAAVRDQRRVGYGRVIRTRDVPNFRSGFYCLAEGPLSGRSEAMTTASDAYEQFPTAYAKQGC